MSRFLRPRASSRFWRFACACGCVAIALGVVVAISLQSSAASEGKDEPSARSIIDKAIEFHGGLKNLSRDVPIVRSEESEMIMEGDKIAIKCEWQYQPPNKRASQALVKVGSLSLRVTQGIVGDKGWIKVGPALAVDLTPEQVLGLTWEHENHVRNAQWLARLRTEFEPVNVKGVKIGEYDAWQVDFKPKATASVKTPLAIFFDKKTGKGVGSEGDHVVPTLGDEKVREKTAKFRAIFKSIIEVEGVKMPGTFTLQRDGVPILEVRKAEVRFVDKIDQKLFEKPK